MQEYLARTYLGNTLQEWFLALLIILVAVVLAKVVYWFFKTIARRFTTKTRNKLDDLLIEVIEKPVTFIAIVVGAWYGINTLTISDSVDIWLNRVFHVLIVVTIAWLLTRLFDSFARQYLEPLVADTDTDLDEQLLPIVNKGTKSLIWILAIILALQNAGYDVAALLAGLGIGGLALAMAAKDTVANIFGGFTIFTDKPFTLNDRVQVSGFDGFVREVGLRSSRIETLDGRIVTIPNAKFADTPVENISAEPSRKVVVKLGLVYDTPPDKMELAMSTLKEIGTSNPNLEEKVLTAFTEFGDFAMDLLFIYFIKKDADILATQTEINLAILKRFNDQGLEFAFPTQTLYTKGIGG
jgi:MscS family membrane protein